MSKHPLLTSFVILLLNSNKFRRLFILCISFLILFNTTKAQHVDNVLEAFQALKTEPEIITIVNKIDVPREGGHFQGIQLIEKNGKEKLIISGSSKDKAYLLQADLATLKTDKLITLMTEPYRHAGGFQVSEPYLAIGIEDNILKTYSKVNTYNYLKKNLEKVRPSVSVYREGEAKQKTAGSVGIINLGSEYLMAVSNWDSRNWDFYNLKETPKTKSSFSAPNDWPSYQSINLLKDNESLYAIGFYGPCKADLIKVNFKNNDEVAMEIINIKTFNCKNGVDFSGAAGLQIDNLGQLHIWGTQKNTDDEIIVNWFSQK